MKQPCFLNLTKIFLICSLFLAGCSGKKADNRVVAAEDTREEVRIPDQESWNSTLVTTNFGKITAQISFGHMAKYEERNEYNFDQNIRVLFYDKKGKLKSSVKADSGFMNESMKIMEVFGHVVAHSDSADMTLYTARLVWNERLNKIISDGSVKITTDMDTLYGIGFESDVDLKHWQIKKPRGHSSRPIDLDIDKRIEGKKKE